MAPSDPTATRTRVAVPGPLPGSEGAATVVSGTGSTAAVEPVAPARDGAADARALAGTEGSREGGSTTSARDAYRARIDRLRERIRGLSTLPDDQARTALSEILTEARSLETSGDPNFIVDDLIALRSCYRSLRSAAAGPVRSSPDYAAIDTSITRVEGTMRAMRGIFRSGARGEAGGDSTPNQRLHMARLALRLSRDLAETTDGTAELNAEVPELITDYRNELELLRRTGDSDLPDRERADRIARDMTELFELRARLHREGTHLVNVEGRDFEMLTDASETQVQDLTTLMRDFSVDLHNSLGFIESRHASDSVDRLLARIIDSDDENSVPRLNVAGLEEYCRLSADAEAALDRAHGLTDPAQRRTALAEALRSYVSLGDSVRVSGIVDDIVASLPADATDQLRLQVFTVVGSILHGSGMAAENRIRELADPIARRLATTPTPEVYHREVEGDEYIGPGGSRGSYVTTTTLVNPRGYLDTAAAVMAARSYYSAVGRSEDAGATDERLRSLRDSIDAQRGTTGPGRLRLELAAATVELDLAVDGTASAEHLGAWRDAVRGATDLPTDERLAQARALLRVATACRREAESSGTSRPDLAEINTWGRDLIGGIAEDRIRGLVTSHHIDAEYAEAVITDFRGRLARAVTEEDTGWLGGVNEHFIDEFADLAQSGHVLLHAERHTPPTAEDRRTSLRAAAIFAQLGMRERVNESMAPLLSYADSIESPTDRADYLLSLGQVFQEAGMTTEANGLLDRIVALDVEGAPREIHRLAEMVPAMREMNLGHLGRARELLAGIHGNPRAEAMLHNVEGSIRRSRALQALDALRIVASEYITMERERGSSRAGESERDIARELDEAQRLILSGRFTSLGAALRHVGGFGLRDMMMESHAASPIEHLLPALDDITLSDDAFSDRMLAFARDLSNGRMYSSASQIGNLLTRNPHTRAAARSLVDEIPGEARLSGILTEIGNMTIIFAESDTAAIRSGVVTLATFGLGRVAAAGAELAFAAYATEAAIASSMTLRATGFLVRSTAEAATFTLSSMAFESLFTGRTDNWSLENFGRQFGSMMVTFMFCHGIGMATSGLGRAAARTTLLGEAAATGGRTLNLGGRIAMGALGYGATITGLTGVEYLNEGLGLHPHNGDVPFFTRLLGSAVMDAQMRLAGRMFNGLTGGAVERWEAGTRERYAIHELMPALERLGFSRPNERGEMSSEAMTVLRAMLGRVARGESAADVAASVTRETSGDLSRITSMVLGVAPESAEGRRLQSLLYAYRTAHPDANLSEVAGRLQLEANRLARAAGLREGPEYETVRAELFRRALASGSTVEALTGLAEPFATLGPQLEGVATDLLGAGGARSLEGQRLIGRLLLRSLEARDGLTVSAEAVTAIQRTLRETGVDPASPEGRRLAADLLLNHVDRALGRSEPLTLGRNSESADSRLDGDVLRLDFRRPGFRHVTVTGHGEIWFGETAVPGEIRIDNHGTAGITVVRTNELPAGSPYHATETLGPESADHAGGSTILRPGDRVRFADGREIVIGEPMRPPRSEAAADTGAGETGTGGTETSRRGARGRDRAAETGPEGLPLAAVPGTATAETTGDPAGSSGVRRRPDAPPSEPVGRAAARLGIDPSGETGANFAAAVEASLGDNPTADARDRRLAAISDPAFANHVDSLLLLNGLTSEAQRRAFAEWAVREGHTPESLQRMIDRVGSGEIRIGMGRDLAVTVADVPAAERGGAADRVTERAREHHELLTRRHIHTAFRVADSMARELGLTEASARVVLREQLAALVGDGPLTAAAVARVRAAMADPATRRAVLSLDATLRAQSVPDTARRAMMRYAMEGHLNPTEIEALTPFLRGRNPSIRIRARGEGDPAVPPFALEGPNARRIWEAMRSARDSEVGGDATYLTSLMQDAGVRGTDLAVTDVPAAIRELRTALGRVSPAMSAADQATALRGMLRAIIRGDMTVAQARELAGRVVRGESRIELRGDATVGYREARVRRGITEVITSLFSAPAPTGTATPTVTAESLSPRRVLNEAMNARARELALERGLRPDTPEFQSFVTERLGEWGGTLDNALADSGPSVRAEMGRARAIAERVGRGNDATFIRELEALILGDIEAGLGRAIVDTGPSTLEARAAAARAFAERHGLDGNADFMSTLGRGLMERFRIGRDLGRVYQLGESFPVLSETFLNNLRGEIRAGRLTLSAEGMTRARELMGSPAFRRALESVGHGERIGLQQAIIFEALEGRTETLDRLVAREAEISAMTDGDARTTARRELSDALQREVARLLNRLDALPGYVLAPRTEATTRAEPAPEVASGGAGFSVLNRFGFTRGTDSIVMDWPSDRRALEAFADPGLPAGPLANLARRARGALETIYDRSLEISRLEREAPADPRIAEARAELAAAEGVVREWEGSSAARILALREGNRMAEHGPPPGPMLGAFHDLRQALEPETAPEGSDLHNLRDRVLEVDSNSPDPTELADAWLDPARGDQGRNPIEAGSVTMVVREAGDIDAVARAAEARFRDSPLASGDAPRFAPEVVRTTGADGSVRLEFRVPGEANARLVVRVVDQATARGELSARRAAFDHALSFEADAAPVPAIRGLGGGDAPSPVAAAGDRATVPPPSRRRAAPVDPAASEGTRVATPRRRGDPPGSGGADPAPDPAVVAARPADLPPAGEGTPTVVIPPAPRPMVDTSRDAFVETALLESAFPDPSSRLGFANYTLVPELNAMAEDFAAAHPDAARSIRGDLAVLSGDAATDSAEFTGAVRRLGTILRLRHGEAEFSAAFLTGPARAEFARRVGEFYGPGAEAALRAAEPPPSSGTAEPIGLAARRDLVQRNLLSLAFSGRTPPTSFSSLRAEPELGELASRLEADGHTEIARDIRNDLGVLNSGDVNGPAFQNALRRLGRVLGLHLGGASEIPVVWGIGDAEFGRLADGIRDVYNPSRGEEVPADAGPEGGDPLDFSGLNDELGLEGPAAERDPMDWSDLNEEGDLTPPSSSGVRRSAPPEGTGGAEPVPRLEGEGSPPPPEGGGEGATVIPLRPGETGAEPGASDRVAADRARRRPSEPPPSGSDPTGSGGMGGALLASPLGLALMPDLPMPVRVIMGAVGIFGMASSFGGFGNMIGGIARALFGGTGGTTTPLATVTAPEAGRGGAIRLSPEAMSGDRSGFHVRLTDGAVSSEPSGAGDYWSFTREGNQWLVTLRSVDAAGRMGHGPGGEMVDASGRRRALPLGTAIPIEPGMRLVRPGPGGEDLFTFTPPPLAAGDIHAGAVVVPGTGVTAIGRASGHFGGDMYVSGHHADIRATDAGYEVVNRSANGLRLRHPDGRIEPPLDQPALAVGSSLRLTHGDEILMGSSSLLFADPSPTRTEGGGPYRAGGGAPELPALAEAPDGSRYTVSSAARFTEGARRGHAMILTHDFSARPVPGSMRVDGAYLVIDYDVRPFRVGSETATTRSTLRIPAARAREMGVLDEAGAPGEILLERPRARERGGRTAVVPPPPGGTGEAPRVPDAPPLRFEPRPPPDLPAVEPREHQDLILVGSHAVADVELHSAGVAEQHFDIRLEDGRWRVHDHGSAAGTYVNGVRVRGAVEIPDGAVISTFDPATGDPVYLFRFRAPRAAAGGEAPRGGVAALPSSGSPPPDPRVPLGSSLRLPSEGPGEFVLGRESASGPQPDLAVGDDMRMVSRRHLRFRRAEDGSLSVRAEAARGTFLWNGHSWIELTPADGWRDLPAGSRLAIGTPRGVEETTAADGTRRRFVAPRREGLGDQVMELEIGAGGEIRSSAEDGLRLREAAAPIPIVAAAGSEGSDRVAAFRGTDRVVINGTTYRVETSAADPVMGEVPPVARDVIRFVNAAGGSDAIALALPRGRYLPEDVAAELATMTPEVRTSLARLRPADAGRIFEISRELRAGRTPLGVEGFRVATGDGRSEVGSAIGSTVTSDGAILGIGSGRTVFRGTMLRDGVRVPVAIVMFTHAMGGSFATEARNLDAFMNAGIGHASIYGAVRSGGRTALITNLAEGTYYNSFGRVPAESREAVARILARDIARVITETGMMPAGDTQFIVGRGPGGEPVVQWIDLETVHPIGDGDRTRARTALGREPATAQDWYEFALREFGIPANMVPRDFREARGSS